MCRSWIFGTFFFLFFFLLLSFLAVEVWEGGKEKEWRVGGRGGYMDLNMTGGVG